MLSLSQNQTGGLMMGGVGVGASIPTPVPVMGNAAAGAAAAAAAMSAGAAAAANAAASAAAASNGLGAVALLPGMGMAAAAPSPLQNVMALTRRARRLHVGNLPLGVGLTPEMLKQFFNAACVSAKLNDPSVEGEPAIDSMIGSEGKFGFVEFRTIAEATSCMALNNIELAGKMLRIERPRDYAPMPDAMIDELRKAGVLGNTSVSPDGQDLLNAAPPTAAALGGMPLLAAPPPPPPAAPRPPALDTSNATAVVMLANMVTEAELNNAEEMVEILEDTKQECEKHGGVLAIAAPKPGAAGEGALDASAIGRKVLVHFETAAAATACALELHGKQFDGRTVEATFASEETFTALLELPCHVTKAA